MSVGNFSTSGREKQRERYRRHSSPPIHQDSTKLAARLPPRPYLINCCDDRHRFTAGLLAAARRRQICLLPPSSTPAALEWLRERYPDHVILRDSGPDPAAPFPRPARSFPAPAPLVRHLRLICFTSGSSGPPTPWHKDGRTLLHGARLALDTLGWRRQRWAVIATTPAQHMFALETCVFWPLCSRLTPTPQRPFYPEDIRRALAAASRPVLLVSTPLHLRACLGTCTRWRNLAAILSATAPLSPELARELESRTGRPLWELYGSTETQSFAWRRPARDPAWFPYPGVELDFAADHVRVHPPWLAAPVTLDDRFEPTGDGRFHVLGRRRELIKVAGKRITLGELNHHLTAIAGVADGCFFPTPEGRVGAVVVSRLSRQTILAHLRRRLDPVFLPRPLLFAEAIPRTATGKVRQEALEALIRRLRRR